MTQKYKELNYLINMDESIQLFSFSFIHSGQFDYDKGTGALRETYGHIWENRARSKPNTYYMGFRSNYLGPQNTNNKGLGFSLRYVAKSLLTIKSML